MASKFVPIKNPSLRETPRSQLAPILPSPQILSLIDWLEQNKRMSARDIQDPDFLESETEISELMETNDDGFEEEEETSEED